MSDGTSTKPAGSVVAWASVKNTFFASILTPESPASGVRIERFKVLPEAPTTDRRAYGVAGLTQADREAISAARRQPVPAAYSGLVEAYYDALNETER